MSVMVLLEAPVKSPAVYRDTGHGIPEPISSELECVLRFLEDED